MARKFEEESIATFFDSMGVNYEREVYYPFHPQ